MSREHPARASSNELNLTVSAGLFDRARQLMPGGITRITIEKYPVPIYMARGKGARLYDVDGNEYLDLNNNFTTLIHGHAFEPVVEAIEAQLRRGSCFANPTDHELELADLLCARAPVAERVRFVNTGTEAVMFAIKAARALTGRYKIAKFEGAYHGAYDWAEVSQNSTPDNWGGVLPTSVAAADGTPPSVLEEVVVLPADDPEVAAGLLDHHAGELACVVIDLLSSRPGLVPFTDAFLRVLREDTRRHGILIIDDEVLNFRQGYNGAAPCFDFEPDLITLGKIIGGGLPVGAIAGPADLMAVFDSSEGTPHLPQGGTFSANPLSLVAGLASMQALELESFDRLDALGERVRDGLRSEIAEHDAPFSITGMGSLFRIHPRSRPPTGYREAFQGPVDAALMRRVATAMARHGVLMPAAAASALSTPMTESDIDQIVAAFEDVLTDGAVFKE